MELSVHIQHSAEIIELEKRYVCFEYLRNSSVIMDKNIDWDYEKQLVHGLQVIFIGKTGYGKSTTLNKIVGRNVFKTDDVAVCTKDLYCALYKISDDEKSFLILSDLPGIGESNYADQHYYSWYKDMLIKSQCVVYVLRADQRDYSIDEVIFKEMFKSSTEREKVMIALNYADKIEPISEQKVLSQKQLLNLNKKMEYISAKFRIPKDDIVYYSATESINLEAIPLKIASKLKKYTFYR